MDTRTLKRFIIFLILFSTNFVYNVGMKDKNDLRLTLAEKNALRELKLLVSGEIKEDFMNSEFYLIRWLRNANLNVEVAKRLLLENIVWREANQIASILDEDFSDLEEDYHLQLKGNDKQGRPVVEVDFGDWDIRAAALQGKLRRLHRWFESFSERAIKAIFAAQEKGKPVTRFIVIFDFDGANIVQQGCPMCVSFLAQWAAEFDRFYTSFTDEIILINVPPLARVVFNSARGIASRDLNSQVVIFDTNKATWMKYLDERISRDQRSPRFGGTAVRV